MQKAIYTIFIFSLLLGGCDSEGNTKGSANPGYSETLTKSKENGVFQFEVVADKSILMLDSTTKIEIKNAWVENTWGHKHYIFGKAPLLKNDSSYQLILNLNIKNSQQKSNHLFYFIGNKPIDSFIHYYCHRIDTIRVPLYKEGSPELPSKKER